MKTVERGMSIEYLRECFDLDADTGLIRWKVRPIHHFKATPKRTAEHSANRTNSFCAGKLAFTSRHALGYLRAELGGRLLQAHRVAFALFNGRWPNGDIDHINGDPSDNRPVNLRDVTHTVNMRNMARRCNNQSGHSGVHWNKRTEKWTASIGGGSQRVYLGEFTDLSEAIDARVAAEKNNGYHPNHGRKTNASHP